MEVFTSEFTVERSLVKDCLRLAISSVLFHRLLGNLKPSQAECCGVTYPTIQDQDLENMLSSKLEDFSQAIQASRDRTSRIVIPFYPSPVIPSSSIPSTSSVSARLSQSPTGAVSSALGWFSATSKALVKGDVPGGGLGEEDEGDRGRQGKGEKCWEVWCLDVKMESGGNGRAEERLRPQLSSHLLRLLAHVLSHPASVPSIRAPDLTPFGYTILINPSPTFLPFSLPPPPSSPSNTGTSVTPGKEMELFPNLYKTLAGTGNGNGSGRAGSKAVRGVRVGWER